MTGMSTKQRDTLYYTAVFYAPRQVSHFLPAVRAPTTENKSLVPDCQWGAASFWPLFVKVCKQVCPYVFAIHWGLCIIVTRFTLTNVCLLVEGVRSKWLDFSPKETHIHPYETLQLLRCCNRSQRGFPAWCYWLLSHWGDYKSIQHHL